MRLKYLLLRLWSMWPLCSKLSEKGKIDMFVATVELRIDTQSNDWIFGSGVSQHMTFHSNVLNDYKDFEAPEPVGLGDGWTVSAIVVSNIKVIT